MVSKPDSSSSVAAIVDSTVTRVAAHVDVVAIALQIPES